MQRPNERPLIDFQQVSYSYPLTVHTPSKDDVQPVPALRKLSVQIQQGEHVAILGHNGSGKSTLARHCNALLLPDDGRVLVDGRDTRSESRVVRDEIGMIFQNPDSQIIATIVEDDVAWALAVRGMPAEQIRARVEQAMEAVGIVHLRKLPPHKLSGGQRQRLAIAGVLALRPRCIIADEATSMLDPLSRREMTELLHRLHQHFGLTILHVTHLLEEAAQAQRIIVMEQGRIVLDASPGVVFGNLSLLRSLNLLIPEPLELANRLRAVGMPIASEAVTIEAIARELVR